MISFKQKLTLAKESHAYCLGVEAFGTKEKCPFEPNTKAASEWYLGFTDAAFLYRMIYDV